MLVILAAKPKLIGVLEMLLLRAMVSIAVKKHPNRGL
jgi:hypothetical protein